MGLGKGPALPILQRPRLDQLFDFGERRDVPTLTFESRLTFDILPRTVTTACPLRVTTNSDKFSAIQQMLYPDRRHEQSSW